MRALAAFLLLALPALGSIPHAWTLHDRVLRAAAVLRARCNKVREIPGSALHRVEILAVLQNRSGVPLDGFLLDDAIPSTIVGARAAVPQDREVLLFVNVIPGRKRLGCLYACSNSVVPIEEEMRVFVEESTEGRRTTGEEFLETVRRAVRDLGELSFLERALEDGRFGRESRGLVEKRLAEVRAAHDGWRAWAPEGAEPGTDPIRRVTRGRPVFEWSEGPKGAPAYGMARDVAIEKALSVSVRWRSRAEASLRIEIREGPRVLWRKTFASGDPARFDATFATARPRGLQVVLAFEAAPAGGTITVARLTATPAPEPPTIPTIQLPTAAD